MYGLYMFRLKTIFNVPLLQVWYIGIDPKFTTESACGIAAAGKGYQRRAFYSRFVAMCLGIGFSNAYKQCFLFGEPFGEYRALDWVSYALCIVKRQGSSFKVHGVCGGLWALGQCWWYQLGVG